MFGQQTLEANVQTVGLVTGEDGEEYLHCHIECEQINTYMTIDVDPRNKVLENHRYRFYDFNILRIGTGPVKDSFTVVCFAGDCEKIRDLLR